MEKIIIDTDIGIDDAFALRLGMLKQDLVGITTVAGNVTADMATRNAKLFCQHYGLNVPICKGATRPLMEEPCEPITDVHGDDGLGGFYHEYFDSTTERNAVDFIISMAKAHPQELTLVAIGPLTNVALALNLCPELAKLLKRLVIMGGAFGHHGHSGNMSNFAEFNINCDPEAAAQVFASSLPTVIVPLDVTYEVLISGEEIAAVGDEFLTNISKHYLQFSFEEEGFYGMAVHDALTIVYLCHPELFTAKEGAVRVSLNGITRGQTMQNPSTMPVPDDCFKGFPAKQVLVDVEVNSVKDFIFRALKGA